MLKASLMHEAIIISNVTHFYSSINKYGEQLHNTWYVMKIHENTENR